jgi:ArsR family transcriptional regulator
MKHPPDSSMPLLARLQTLGDLARLRLLRLLEANELSVGELARAMQLPQSTVSRHLKVLHEGKWIARRVEGTASLYRLATEDLEESARDLWQTARRQLGDTPTLREDDHRLAGVLAARTADSRSFFGRLGGDWDSVRSDLFGESFTAEALLSLINPAWTVADLGCGTGQATALLAPLVRKVIAIDREPAMLDAARARVAGARGVEFRAGDLARLPLRAGEIDAAIMLLVMIYIADPAAAAREVARALRPGGVLLVVDMVAHDRESYRHTMGHQHLGFEERDVRTWSRAAGFAETRWRRLRPDTSARGPGLFAATMKVKEKD